MTTPTPTVYHSRSRTNRRRILIAVATLVLVLVGFLIGKLQGDSPAAGSNAATTPPSAPPSAPPSPDEPSPEPTTPTGVDAYAVIQAENAVQLNGIDKQDTADAGGGQNVGWIANGDSMRFDDINFGDPSATRLIARVASDAGEDVRGRMEIRLDSPTAAPVATLPIGRTGGWQNWTNQATDVSGATGTHAVFVTFAADKGDDFLNLNYFRFER